MAKPGQSRIDVQISVMPVTAADRRFVVDVIERDLAVEAIRRQVSRALAVPADLLLSRGPGRRVL